MKLSPLQLMFDMWHRFSNAFSDMQIHMWLVVSIAVLFIVLHYLRRFPIIRNISIAFSFIPVLIHGDFILKTHDGTQRGQAYYIDDSKIQSIIKQ